MRLQFPPYSEDSNRARSNAIVLTGVFVLASLGYFGGSHWLASVRFGTEIQWSRLFVDGLYVSGTAGLLFVLIWRGTLAINRHAQEYVELFNGVHDVLLVLDAQGMIRRANAAVYTHYGYHPKELRGRCIFDLLPERHHAEARAAMSRVFSKASRGPVQMEFMRKDGTVVAIETIAKLVEYGDGRPPVLEVVVRDLTERLKQLQRIHKQNRLYAVINELNQVMARATNRVQLFEQICEIVFEKGGFRMVWIGQVLEDGAISVASSAGDDDGYLGLLLEGDGTTPIKSSAARQAVTTRMPAIENDIGGRVSEGGWPVEAHRRRYGSACAFPLVLDEHVEAVLAMYAEESHFFEDNEVALLRGVAADLAFAMQAMRLDRERRESELAIRESEIRYRCLLGAVTDYVYSVTMEDGVVTGTKHNEACRAVTGYAPEEFERGPLIWFSMIHPSDRDAVLTHIERFHRDGEIQTFEHRIYRKDGQLRSVRTTLVPRRLENGVLCGYDGLVRDVTSEVEAIESLRQREMELATAQRIAQCGSWTYDIERQSLTWSEQQYELHAIARDTVLLAGTGLERVHPADRERVERHFAQMMTSDGGPTFLEYRLTLPDGSIRHILGTATLVCAADGVAVSAQGTCMDITHLKEVEEALRERERQLRGLVEQVPGVIYRASLKPDEPFLYVSPQLGELIGESGAILKASWVETIHADDRERVLEEIRSSYGSYRAFTLEYRIRSIGADEIWVRDSAQCIYSEEGTPLYYQGLMLNITKQKRMEVALSVSQRYFEELISAAPLPIIAFDASSTVVSWNSAATAIFGWSAAEVIGQRPPFHGETPSELPDELVALALRGTVIKGRQIRLQAKDGRWLSLNLSIAPLIEADNQITGAIAVLEDLTDRLLIERERLRLAAVVEQAAESIAITGLDGMLRYVNPAFERITGYSSEEVLGRNPKLLKSGKHGPEFYEDLWGTVLSGRIWRGHIVNRRKSGELIEEEASIIPVTDDSGQITCFAAVMRDITHERQLERQYLQSQKMEAIGTLAGGIAHDFNNLLSGIMGYTELAQSALPSNCEAATDLARVMEASCRARDLVQQILTFSRKTERRAEPVIVRESVEEVVRLVKASMPSSIRVITDIDPNAGVVLADPSHIHQIIMNLCTNAFHAMRQLDAGRLTISLQPYTCDTKIITDHMHLPAGDYVCISVSDNGHGMDRRTIERIFEPFYTTKSVGDGTGLGLSTVHGIVSRYEGHIDVRSALGQGATFEVYLPRVQINVHEASYENALIRHGNGQHVLVVDDVPMLAHLAQRILLGLGYRATAFVRPLEALDAFRREPTQYDFILTDYTMPDMSGETFVRAVTELRPGIPVVMASGYNERISQELLDQLGIRAFLDKPLTRKALADTFAGLCVERSKTAFTRVN